MQHEDILKEIYLGIIFILNLHDSHIAFKAEAWATGIANSFIFSVAVLAYLNPSTNYNWFMGLNGILYGLGFYIIFLKNKNNYGLISGLISIFSFYLILR